MVVGGRYRADVSVAKDRRGLASHAESSGKRQPRATRNTYQGWTGKPFQGDLPDTSDFLLRCRVPASLRNRSALSCPGHPHASSNLAAGGRAHDARSIPRGVKVSAARLLSLFGALGTMALFGTCAAKAQDAEPRSYSNTPVGLNFLIAGALYSQGKLAFDPDLSVADANFHSNTGLLAYVRSFDFAGQSAKFDVIVPASSFAASGPCRRPAAGARDGGPG